MLERMADELERSAGRDGSAQVDLATAAELSGFTRGHLRRLIRVGKLPVTPNEAGDPQVRLADLPRKPGHRAAGARPPAAATCRREIAIGVLRREGRKNSG
jgi:hypothetical protein